MFETVKALILARFQTEIVIFVEVLLLNTYVTHCRNTCNTAFIRSSPTQIVSIALAKLYSWSIMYNAFLSNNTLT